MEGYLGESLGMVVLSSSKELVEAGVRDEVSVRIRGPVETQESIFDQHAYTWVSVTGVFNVKEKNGTTDDLLLGQLSPPLAVRSLQFPAPIQKAGFGDIILDMEDIK
jgi:hypothetical protein